MKRILTSIVEHLRPLEQNAVLKTFYEQMNYHLGGNLHVCLPALESARTNKKNFKRTLKELILKSNLNLVNLVY